MDLEKKLGDGAAYCMHAGGGAMAACNQRQAEGKCLMQLEGKCGKCIQEILLQLREQQVEA